MDERYQQEAGFGEDTLISEDDPIDDEVVLDEVPEEGDSDEEYDDNENSEEGDDSNEIKHLDKAQIRINRITKERYKAEAKAKKLAAEADHWRQKYKISSDFNLKQMELNANARLDKARSAQLSAIESGDAQAQVDANFAMTAATTDLQDINKEKMRSEYEERIKEHQSPPQEDIDTEIAHEWIHENIEWINPQSKTYDPELTEYIARVDYELGNRLRSNNETHLIGSSEYIEKLEEYKNYFLSQRTQSSNNSQNTNQMRDFKMRQARGGASPVRNSSQTQHRGNKSMDLTPAEKAMIESISHTGVTEEIFKKAKIEDMKRRKIERGES